MLQWRHAGKSPQESGALERSAATALTALEADGGRILVDLEQMSPSQWIVSHLGAKVLLPGRESWITLSDANNQTYLGAGRFSVGYPCGDGGMERYG